MPHLAKGVLSDAEDQYHADRTEQRDANEAISRRHCCAPRGYGVTSLYDCALRYLA